MRVLAEVLASVETATPYGGRAVNYEPMGVTWLKPGVRRRRERTDASVIDAVETLEVETRGDDRLLAGRVLRFGGTGWRIVSVDPGDGSDGRVRLGLESGR